MSKNYIAYTFLTLAALFWSGNFIIGKFATLFEVPPLSLNFYRWVIVWLLLLPFTAKSLIKKFDEIKKNFGLFIIMGITGVSVFNSVVYFALNFTQVINAVLMISVIPVAVIFLTSFFRVEKFNIFQLLGLIISLVGVVSIISKGSSKSVSYMKTSRLSEYLCVR